MFNSHRHRHELNRNSPRLLSPYLGCSLVVPEGIFETPGLYIALLSFFSHLCFVAGLTQSLILEFRVNKYLLDNGYSNKLTDFGIITRNYGQYEFDSVIFNLRTYHIYGGNGYSHERKVLSETVDAHIFEINTGRDHLCVIAYHDFLYVLPSYRYQVFLKTGESHV
jgi:hypothetical protein